MDRIEALRKALAYVAEAGPLPILTARKALAADDRASRAQDRAQVANHSGYCPVCRDGIATGVSLDGGSECCSDACAWLLAGGEVR